MTVLFQTVYKNVKWRYESDLALALGAIGDLVRANPRVLTDPAPVIQVVSLADSAVQIAVRPWVAVSDYGMVAGELRWYRNYSRIRYEKHYAGESSARRSAAGG